MAIARAGAARMICITRSRQIVRRAQAIKSSSVRIYRCGVMGPLKEEMSQQKPNDRPCLDITYQARGTTTSTPLAPIQSMLRGHQKFHFCIGAVSTLHVGGRGGQVVGFPQDVDSGWRVLFLLRNISVTLC